MLKLTKGEWEQFDVRAMIVSLKQPRAQLFPILSRPIPVTSIVNQLRSLIKDYYV